jgi:hypothetical protein
VLLLFIVYLDRSAAYARSHQAQKIPFKNYPLLSKGFRLKTIIQGDKSGVAGLQVNTRLPEGTLAYSSLT